MKKRTIILGIIAGVASVIGIGALGWGARVWAERFDEKLTGVSMSVRLQEESLRNAELSDENKRLRAEIKELQGRVSVSNMAPLEMDWLKTNQALLESLAAAAKQTCAWVEWGTKVKTEGEQLMAEWKQLRPENVTDYPFESMQILDKYMPKLHTLMADLLTIAAQNRQTLERQINMLEGASLLTYQDHEGIRRYTLRKFPFFYFRSDTGDLVSLIPSTQPAATP